MLLLDLYYTGLRTILYIKAFYVLTFRSEDDDLKLAMQLSKSLMEEGEADTVIDQSNVISEEDELQKAIAMSLEGECNGTQIVLSCYIIY